jgi:hypothetical protein
MTEMPRLMSLSSAQCRQKARKSYSIESAHGPVFAADPVCRYGQSPPRQKYVASIYVSLCARPGVYRRRLLRGEIFQHISSWPVRRHPIEKAIQRFFELT